MTASRPRSAPTNLIPAADVATELGCTTRDVEDLIRDGVIGGARTSAGWVVYQASLDQIRVSARARAEAERVGIIPTAPGTLCDRDLTPDRDGMLTQAQVAARFGVDRRTVGRWVRLGFLTPITGGRWPRYSADQVDALLREEEK